MPHYNESDKLTLYRKVVVLYVKAWDWLMNLNKILKIKKRP